MSIGDLTARLSAWLRSQTANAKRHEEDMRVVRELKREIARLKREKQSLVEQLHDQTAEIGHLTADYDDLKKQRDERDLRIEQLEGKNEVLKIGLEDLYKERHRWHAQMDRDIAKMTAEKVQALENARYEQNGGTM